MKKFLISLCLALPLGAVSLSVSASATDGCRVTGTISQDTDIQLFFGTTNGSQYTWATNPMVTGQQGANSGDDSGVVGISPFGLKDGQTYYMVLQAYTTGLATVSSFTTAGGVATVTLSSNSISPGDTIALAGIYPVVFRGNYVVSTSVGNVITFPFGSTGYVSGGSVMDLTKISSAGQVTSSQMTCTFSAGASYPAPPTAYLPTYPTISSPGYTIVPLTVNGSNQLVAASSVTHTGGLYCASDPTWSVTMGDSIQTILWAESPPINFGLVLEFPQGSLGYVPTNLTSQAPSSGNGPTQRGWSFPNLVDPCLGTQPQRWLMLRTHQINAGDFPPWQPLTQDANGDVHGGPMRIDPSWTNVATIQAQAPSSASSGGGGQIFDTVLGASATTPVHHIWVSCLQFTVNGSNSNNWSADFFGLSPTEQPDQDSTYAAHDIVLDRLILTVPALPAMAWEAIGGGFSSNFAVLGVYAPGFQNQLGNAASGFGKGLFILDCSGSGLTAYNSELGGSGQPLYLESVARYNAATPSHSCGLAGPRTLTNVVIQKIAIYSPPTWPNLRNAGYGQWDGITRPSRNCIEAKNIQTAIIHGNWLDGCFAYQNEGNAIFLSTVNNGNPTPGATGINDVDVGYNYIRHAATLLNVSTAGPNSCCGYAPNPKLPTRIRFHHMLSWQTGIRLYETTGQGAAESELVSANGAQTLMVDSNTFDVIDPIQYPYNVSVGYPWQLWGVNGGPLSSYVTVNNNVWPYSVGGGGDSQSGVWMDKTPSCNFGCGAFPQIPEPSGSTNAATWLTGAVTLGATTSTPAGVWGGNVQYAAFFGPGQAAQISAMTATNPAVVSMEAYDVQFWATGMYMTLANVQGTGCSGANNTAFLVSNVNNTSNTVTIAYNATGCTYTANTGYTLLPEMTTAQIATASADAPPGDTWVPGANLASRIAAAGLLGYANGDFRITPTPYNYGGSAGTNIQALISQLGIVKNISTLIAPNAITVNYIAPDSTSCSVDVWIGSGTHTRGTYSGSPGRSQSITITGLISGTAYSGQVMCNYLQNRVWFSFPSEPSNLNTQLSFTTPATGTRTIAFGYTALTNPPEASRIVTVTPVGAGSLSPVTCTSSPCSLPGVPQGAYSAAYTVKNSGGSTISTGSFTALQ